MTLEAKELTRNTKATGSGCNWAPHPKRATRSAVIGEITGTHMAKWLEQMLLEPVKWPSRFGPTLVKRHPRVRQTSGSKCDANSTDLDL